MAENDLENKNAPLRGRSLLSRRVVRQGDDVNVVVTGSAVKVFCTLTL
jgi:hypothetical protein